MTTTDWIQAISAGISAFATIVLARITYIYVRETRRMAEFMKTQTDLAQFTFDKDIKPICSLYFYNRSSNENEGNFEYDVRNNGKEIFTIKKIILKIFKEHRPSEVLFQKEIEINYDLAPKHSRQGVSKVDFPITISDELKNVQERKNIKYRGFISVKDIKNVEYEFSDTYRTLWS